MIPHGHYVLASLNLELPKSAFKNKRGDPPTPEGPLSLLKVAYVRSGFLLVRLQALDHALESRKLRPQPERREGDS